MKRKHQENEENIEDLKRILTEYEYKINDQNLKIQTLEEEIKKLKKIKKKGKNFNNYTRKYLQIKFGHIFLLHIPIFKSK